MSKDSLDDTIENVEKPQSSINIPNLNLNSQSFAESENEVNQAPGNETLLEEADKEAFFKNLREKEGKTLEFERLADECDTKGFTTMGDEDNIQKEEMQEEDDEGEGENDNPSSNRAEIQQMKQNQHFHRREESDDEEEEEDRGPISVGRKDAKPSMLSKGIVYNFSSLLTSYKTLLFFLPVSLLDSLESSGGTKLISKDDSGSKEELGEVKEEDEKKVKFFRDTDSTYGVLEEYQRHLKQGMSYSTKDETGYITPPGGATLQPGPTVGL